MTSLQANADDIVRQINELMNDVDYCKYEKVELQLDKDTIDTLSKSAWGDGTTNPQESETPIRSFYGMPVVPIKPLHDKPNAFWMCVILYEKKESAFFDQCILHVNAAHNIKNFL